MTIRVASASVAGKSERILVNAAGLPLYIYGGDRATQSHVTGGLAQLWPPLVSASPSESGPSGKLSVVPTANGRQVQYNTHFLYTFVDDTLGELTGQGVQGFFVATPSLGASSNVATPPVTSRTSPYGGY